ncbi:hypothetical protein SAMN06295885_3024 [Rathayibacter oskolensis]|uniref:Uncharacterized protein n=1 Tax=Rathayibacter oskolensis TaxID=1891671 RepID=A0A1X7P9X7_9MICO|nr:hypothetical protein [Rathayibacter oskolensis]SMH47697.1 hypothetical protein SAMN06295885_3024 [Rathayibacter oskolensis]
MTATPGAALPATLADTVAVTVQSVSWTGVVLALVAGVVGAVLALRLHRPRLAWVSVGATSAAFLLTGLGGTSAPWPLVLVVAVLAFALAVIGGGPVVLMTLDLATTDARSGTHGGIMIAGPTTRPAAGSPTAIGQPIEVLRGGTTIGVLERIATAGALMSGLAEGVAVVVAVKGVGRFSELASPEARERFIIGTLASLAWSAALGTLARLYLAG